MTNLPIIGCPSCATTLGRRGCPVHKDNPTADLLAAAIARAEKSEALHQSAEATLFRVVAALFGPGFDVDETAVINRVRHLQDRIAALEAELAEERTKVKLPRVMKGS